MSSGMCGSWASSSRRISSATIGNPCLPERRLALQANWLRTTQLGSDFANRTKSAARSWETACLSANRRTVQARTDCCGMLQTPARRTRRRGRRTRRSPRELRLPSPHPATIRIAAETRNQPRIGPLAEKGPKLAALPRVRLVEQGDDFVRRQFSTVACPAATPARCWSRAPAATFGPFGGDCAKCDRRHGWACTTGCD